MKPAAVSMAASFEPKVFMPMFFQARCPAFGRIAQAALASPVGLTLVKMFPPATVTASFCSQD